MTQGSGCALTLAQVEPFRAVAYKPCCFVTDFLLQNGDNAARGAGAIHYDVPKSLYLHVPFCPKVCPYCDFHKMHRNERLVAAYLDRLEEEAGGLYSEFPGKLETIYFGGGTPSHLSDEELARVVTTLGKTWGWPALEETTLEADPLTFDKARLQTFKELGFNRLSIGLQSSQDRVLDFLGRIHSGKQGLEAVEMALAAGFEVSADLITGIRGQNTRQDLHALAQTGVPHISVYSLTIEPYTPFARRGITVDEDKEANDYNLTNEILSRYGLLRYEVSSHAQPGHESKHNQVYWHGAYFLALGPSAASFVPPAEVTEKGSEIEGANLALEHQPLMGERRTNPAIKAWLEHAPPDVMPVSPDDYVLDLLMTGLRTLRGVNIEQIQKRTGINLIHKFQILIQRFIKEGLLELDSPYLRATEKGLLHLNPLLRQLFNFS